MDLDLIQIEGELKKRLTYPYKWGRKQNDEFDRLTNFVYRTSSFEEILKEIDMNLEEFNEVCDRFTNKKIFKCDARGNLIKNKKIIYLIKE